MTVGEGSALANAPTEGHGFLASVRFLLRSPLFSEVTGVVRGRVILCGVLLVVVSLAGLFAIEAQARFLEALSTGGDGLWQVFVTFVLVQIVYEVSQALKRLFQNQVAVQVTQHVKLRIYDKALALDFTRLAAENPGELTQRFAGDATQLGAVWAEGILSFLMTLVMVTSVSLFLCLRIGFPGLVFMAILVVLVYLARRFSQQAVPLLTNRMEASGARLAEVQQAVAGVATLKMLTAEQVFLERVKSLAAREERMRLRTNKLNSLYIPVFATLRWVGWAVILIWLVSVGGSRGGLAREGLVGLLFAVNWYSALLQESFLMVGMYLNFIQSGSVSAARIDAFLAIPALAPEFHPPLAAENVLETEALTVEYPTRAGVRVLDGMSVAFARGTLTLVVGRFGSGKTSLLRALLGELEPRAGRIRRAAGLKVALVTQDAFLHTASVRDAMRLAFEDDSAEDDELRTLLQAVDFTQDLEGLDAGLGTFVGDRGVALSGGQKQRLSLARAAYFDDADVIMLDDPLSALDRTTAARVTESLILGRWAGKTRVLTSHRLECAPRADVVLVLEAGKQLASGTHGELLAGCTVYQELWSKSFLP